MGFTKVERLAAPRGEFDAVLDYSSARCRPPAADYVSRSQCLGLGRGTPASSGIYCHKIFRDHKLEKLTQGFLEGSVSEAERFQQSASLGPPPSLWSLKSSRPQTRKTHTWVSRRASLARPPAGTAPGTNLSRSSSNFYRFTHLRLRLQPVFQPIWHPLLSSHLVLKKRLARPAEPPKQFSSDIA